MNRNYIIIVILILFSIVGLSIGYTALSTKLSINDIIASIRIEKNIRITGISVDSFNEDGMSNYEDYNATNISAGIYLPNNNSSITYKVNITNFEAPEVGILDITGLPDNLEYSISNYTLNDKICNDNKCSLGITKDIYITIKYKDGGYDESNTSYAIVLNFDFRNFYNLTYENIAGDYPTEVLDGSNFVINFSNYIPSSVTVYMGGSQIENFSYINGILTVNNVSGDLKIISYLEYPNLSDSGLIPVKYINNNWVVCDSTDWYDYGNQQWANAVILKNNVYKGIGDIINISTEVRAMFVWIPRFEYKISNDGSNEIYINFISKEQVDSSAGYRIHPAFTFGNSNLSGIWFGKFETSSSQSSTCYLNPTMSNCNNSNQEPYIIPNVKSLREQNINYQYLTAKKMVNYLSDSINADSHMVKNSEWGAVAYLSQSQYGKYGNTNYTESNREIYANTSPDLYTGMSGGTPFYSTEDAPLYSYDVDFSYDNEMMTNEKNGIGASTTGNITGIYDMNGGAYEYVMGYLTTASYTWGSAASYNYAGFTSAPASQYYDAFTTTNTGTSCSNSLCYGHALSETAGWYNDDMTFLSSENPWLMRGGVFDSGVSSGIFSYIGTLGYSGSYATFRIALVFP